MQLGVTYRQVDSSRNAIKLQVQGLLGAGQGREASGPIWRQGTVVQTPNGPVNPKDAKCIVSQAATVLHGQAHLLHLGVAGKHAMCQLCPNKHYTSLFTNKTVFT